MHNHLVRPEQVSGQNSAPILVERSHRASNTNLTKVAPRLLQQCFSRCSMFLLIIGITKKMLQETLRKLNIFNQTNLDQHIDTPWTITDTWVDFLWIVAGSQ